MATAVVARPPTQSEPVHSAVNGASEKPAEDCGCDADTPAPVTDKIPTAEELEKIGHLPVQDEAGKSYKFSEIYGDPSAERHLVTFVRHFFCGNCREYIRALSSSIPPSALPPNTKLTLIGCGTPSLIGEYVQATNCAYPVYTDPSHELYKALNLARTLSLGEKPQYIKQNFFTMFFTSCFGGIKAGKNMLKGGDSWQVGGEFLFVKKGENWEVEWCHRMKTTRDHTEMGELKKVLGVKE